MNSAGFQLHPKPGKDATGADWNLKGSDGEKGAREQGRLQVQVCAGLDSATRRQQAAGGGLDATERGQNSRVGCGKGHQRFVGEATEQFRGKRMTLVKGH